MEHLLAKERVAGSIPVSRLQKISIPVRECLFFVIRQMIRKEAFKNSNEVEFLTSLACEALFDSPPSTIHFLAAGIRSVFSFCRHAIRSQCVLLLFLDRIFALLFRNPRFQLSSLWTRDIHCFPKKQIPEPF